MQGDNQTKKYTKEERYKWYMHNHNRRPSIFDRIKCGIKELKWAWYVRVWVILWVVILIGSISDNAKIPFYYVGIALWGFITLHTLKDGEPVIVKNNKWQTIKNFTNHLFAIIITLALSVAISPLLTFLLNYLINPMRLISP